MIGKLMNTSRQPLGLYWLFLIEMWERYGFYTVNGMLILFLSKYMHLSDTAAYQLFALFGALLYVSPVVGGYLADRYLTYHQALLIGACCLCAGYALLAVPITNCFYLGVSMLTVGMGFFKFAPSAMLGRLYKGTKANIDSGYTIFYMGINIGSFSAFLLSGYIAKCFGWHAAFLSAAVGVLIGLFLFLLCRRRCLNSANNHHQIKPMRLLQTCVFLAGLIVAVALVDFLMRHVHLANTFVVMLIALFLGYLAMSFRRLATQEKRQLVLILLLSLIAIGFFVLYCQQPMSVTLFTDRHIAHHLWGIYLPTAAFESLNPIWIIALSPVMAHVYQKQSSGGGNIAKKYAVGILVMALAYAVLALGCYWHQGSGPLSALWLVLSYGLQSLAELLVSALGLSMIARYSPDKLQGVLMGGWFIAQAAGSLLAGCFSQLASAPKQTVSVAESLHIYQHCFSLFACFSLLLGVLVYGLAGLIMRLAKQRQSPVLYANQLPDFNG